MKQSKAFTLIELLVVIAIIGFIASIVLVNLQGVRGRGRIAAGKQFSSSLQHTLGAYAVGIWRFETGSGTTASDSSGYINNGTLTGGTTWRTETECGLELGGCLEFDGSTGYVTMGDVDEFEGIGALTVAVWFNTRKTTGSQGIVVKNGPIYLFLPAGKIRGGIYNGSEWKYATGSETLSTNTWYHAALVFDTPNISVYLNGRIVATTTTTGNAANTGAAFVIGADSCCGWRYFFDGFIDDVHIFTTGLTTVQIQKLYAEGLKKHTITQN